MGSTHLARLGLTVTTVALMSGALAQNAAPATGLAQESGNVEVHVTVAEKSGRLVPNLGPVDFELQDSGRRRPVLDVRRPSSSLVLLVLIDASASMTEKFEVIGTAVEKLAAELRSNDVGRLATFSERMMMKGPIGNRAAIIGALEDQLNKSRPTAMWDSVDLGLTVLSSETGRRAMVLVTDGEDTASRRTDLDGVVLRAQSEDVVIHAIGVPPPARPRLSFVPARGPAGVPTPPAPIPETRRVPDPSLRHLAEQTGGGYLELTNELAKGTGIGAIAQEMRGQYVLTFAPERLDGKMHDLRVRVTGSDAAVRVKRKFQAPQPGGTSRETPVRPKP